MFDHDADVVGLVNVSIHGPPGDPATQVVAAALFDVGWRQSGSATSLAGSWADASITLTSVSTAAASVAFGDDDRVLAAATVDGLRLDAWPRPTTDPYAIEDPAPLRFGLDRLACRSAPGRRGLRRAGRTPSHRGARSAYHDHTWGRWHWGDDIGWEWGSFLGRTGSSIVIGRTSDRAHDACGPFSVVIDHDGAPPVVQRRTGRVSVEWRSRPAEPPPPRSAGRAAR